MMTCCDCIFIPEVHSLDFDVEVLNYCRNHLLDTFRVFRIKCFCVLVYKLKLLEFRGTLFNEAVNNNLVIPFVHWLWSYYCKDVFNLNDERLGHQVEDRDVEMDQPYLAVCYFER